MRNNIAGLMFLGENIKLHVGEKIAIIRKVKGLTQENLARSLGCSDAKISRIERGLTKCSDEMLDDIREVLGIKRAPLLEAEGEVFKNRLELWYKEIKARHMEQAQNMYEELAVIKYLPFEKELNTLFDIIETKYLMVTDDIDRAKQRFEKLETLVCNMTTENLFHYYYNKGSLNIVLKDYKTALDCYLKANELSVPNIEKDATFYYKISGCYSGLHMPMRSILYAQKAYGLFSLSDSKRLELYLDMVLGCGYAEIGELKLARELFDKCLIYSKSIYYDEFIGASLHNIAYVYYKNGEYNQAFTYFTQARKYIGPESDNYLNSIYDTARSLQESGEYAECRKLLNREKDSFCRDEDSLILFDILRHFLSLNQDISCKFILKTAIPHLIEKNDFYKALDLCDALEKHFERCGKCRKKLEVKAVSSEILRKIFIINSR